MDGAAPKHAFGGITPFNPQYVVDNRHAAVLGLGRQAQMSGAALGKRPRTHCEENFQFHLCNPAARFRPDAG
jgi:hypothetical protein